MSGEHILTALFFACSAICCLNIRAIIRDRNVQGVSTIPTWVFLSTNLFEVAYFGTLGFYWMAGGAVLMSLANLGWLAIYWWLRLDRWLTEQVRILLDFDR